MTTQVEATKLHDWMRSSLSSDLTQAERERDKLVSEIGRAIDSLRTFCAQLAGKAEQDMETKRENRAQYRAAKAVMRLTSIILDMYKDFTTPTSKDSTRLRGLQRETSKLASEAARTRETWLRQIRPYYILDMMTLGGNIDKLRRLGDELHNFLMGRGALLRSLEELDEKLTSLKKSQASKELATSQTHAIQEKLAETNSTGESLKSHFLEIQRNPKVTRFMEADSELRKLRNELIGTGFSRLGGPLKRLMSISERGDYPLPADVRESTKEYVRRPFATFLTEEDGYPRLKSVMTALSRGVSTGKLAVKAREAKKVIERSEQIVEGNSLERIHNDARERKKAYDQFLADPETAKLVHELKDLRNRGRANHVLREEFKTDLQRALNNEKRSDEQIHEILHEIESFSRKISGEDVKLQLAE
jgi:cell fate (sporulation/competence/biofilm development) regulator YlbF (YheA/YmcA/DUF963 family)